MLRARNLDISEIAETAQIAQIAQPPASTALGTTKEHTRTQQGAHALGGGRRLLAGLLAQIEPRGEHLTPPPKKGKSRPKSHVWPNAQSQIEYRNCDLSRLRTCDLSRCLKAGASVTKWDMARGGLFRVFTLARSSKTLGRSLGASRSTSTSAEIWRLRRYSSEVTSLSCVSN